MVSDLQLAHVIATSQPILTFDDVADLDRAAEMISRLTAFKVSSSHSRPRTPVEF